ncbi:MAG: putative metal-binding motif-containing protein, partial [Candidatus Calescibacterium sp.]
GEGRYGYSITNYYIGIGIHHNLISRVLYEAIGDGLACIWIDKYTPTLGEFVGRFLKTDSFGFLIPQLKDRYPGKEMAIEIIPNYKDPGNPSGNSGGAASYNRPLSVVAYAKTGGPTFRPVLSVYAQTSTRANFWNEFVQNATYGSSFTMFVHPTTWFDTADLMIDIPYLDISFNVVTTGSLTDPVASQTWMRVFGLTVGVKLSLDLDIVPCVSPDCGKTVEFPGPDTIDFSRPLTSYYRDYYGNPVDPTQGGNYFPEGFTFARVIDLTLYVDPDVRYFIAYNTNALGLSGSDWEGILANILPVILNGVAGARLRLALDELPTLIIGALLGNAALLGNTTTSRIGWALRTLRAPIELNFPWVGPEFGSSLMWDQPFGGEPSKDNVGDYFEIFIHWRGRYQRLLTQLMFALIAALARAGGGEEGSGILNFLSCDFDKDGFEDLRCGGDDCNDFNRDINPKAFDGCDGIDNDCDGLIDEGNCDNMPPGSCGPLPLDYKVCTCGDADGDGYRNSFCGGNDCNDLDPFINPGMVDYCGDGIDQDCDGLVDEDTTCDCEIVLQCLYRTAPAPKAVNLQSGNGFNNGSENGVRVSRSLTPPETFITYTSDPHALYTKIEFAAWSPHSSKFRYSWRLDGGTWNLWQRENSVVLTHLLEGWHVFEVRAQDENKLIAPTPARYVFRIDSIGPDIRLTALKMVRGSKFKAFIDVQDAQAQKSETLVSWKLNDGEWSEWVPASELTSIEINSLAKGEHILHIRAKDDVGNISTYSHRFFVLEKPRVFGCSSTAGASFGFLLIFIIFISLRFPFSAIAKRK